MKQDSKKQLESVMTAIQVARMSGSGHKRFSTPQIQGHLISIISTFS